MMNRTQATIGVDRCIFELRQGRAVCLDGYDDRLVYVSVESDLEASRSFLEELAGDTVQLLLTASRAKRLGLGGKPLAISLDSAYETNWIRDLAFADPGPLTDFADVGKAIDITDDALVASAFYVARVAEALPALLAVRTSQAARAGIDRAVNQGMVLTASVDAVATYRRSATSQVYRLSEAPVPLAASRDVRFVAYRGADALTDHLAILVGQPELQETPLVRLHSACITGDAFHSLRCDCGEQLSTALDRMAEAGHGIVCYLAQEGRGIGIGNKLRTYNFQDHGLDTLEANEALGFAADERDFAIAARMLEDLGIGSVRLLTNNPDKIGRLTSAGIDVFDRVPMNATLNPFNQRYISARVEKSGYMFGEGQVARDDAA
ncbi:MAG: GTP cyclohydrolase II [Geminicoccaceae bacterium]